jgi:hypothetical protein
MDNAGRLLNPCTEMIEPELNGSFCTVLRVSTGFCFTVGFQAPGANRNSSDISLMFRRDRPGVENVSRNGGAYPGHRLELIGTMTRSK